MNKLCVDQEFLLYITSWKPRASVDLIFHMRDGNSQDSQLFNANSGTLSGPIS